MGATDYQAMGGKKTRSTRMTDQLTLDQCEAYLLAYTSIYAMIRAAYADGFLAGQKTLHPPAGDSKV